MISNKEVIIFWCKYKLYGMMGCSCVILVTSLELDIGSIFYPKYSEKSEQTV